MGTSSTTNRPAENLRSYRRKGLDRLATALVEQLRPGVAGATVLEVGGGIGAIGNELIAAGAGSSLNVEISAAYEGRPGSCHDPAQIVATSSARGLSPVFQKLTPGWQAVVLERS